jgi:mannose-6-phosphate isomerase-like protein (cupin superfamily)
MKFVLVAFCLSSLSLVVVAQNSGAPPAIYKPGVDIEAELAQAEAGSASAGGWGVSVSPGVTVRRRSSAVAQYAIFHPFSTEVYRILEGSGTFVTGGRLNLPLAASDNPDIIRTEKGIEGGLARKVSAGDVLVLQPGTPHWFSSIDGEAITYLETRIRIATHPVRYQ